MNTSLVRDDKPALHLPSPQNNLSKSHSKFIQKLMLESSVEGFLSGWLRFGKKRFAIKNLILHFHNEIQFVCSGTQHIHKRKILFPWKGCRGLQTGNKSDSCYLAKELGRPVFQVLTLPFAINTCSVAWSKHKGGAILSKLFFKGGQLKTKVDSDREAIGGKNKYHDTKSMTSALFIELKTPEYACQLSGFCVTWKEALKPLLGNLWESYQLEQEIKLLTKTLNAFQDPLAVFDQDRKVLYSNGAFKNICSDKEKAKELLAAKRVNIKNNIYQRSDPSLFGEVNNGCLFMKMKDKEAEYGKTRKVTTEKPESLKNNKLFIAHFSDITRCLKLSEKHIQGVRMQALGGLADSVAHRLNNPLTGMHCMVELLLQNQSLSFQTKTDLRDIKKAVTRSQNIIEHLLDFSRGHLPLRVVDLKTQLKHTLCFLKSLLCKVHLELELADTPVRAKVQSCLLQQVIFNLIKNACQAVSRSSFFDNRIRVRVSACQNKAILSVEDNGQGISTSDLEHIFDPFFSTKPKHQGAGLGLSVSKNIVDGLKGELVVNKSFLGGACFTLKLPLIL